MKKAIKRRNRRFNSQGDCFVLNINDIIMYISNIKAGDLLYWSKDGGETIYHATIITLVDNDRIGFSGHTRNRKNEDLKVMMDKNNETVIVIKMK